MTNTTKLIPEETLIYKELKSKLEAELWEQVEVNLKQVIESDSPNPFKNSKYLLECFIWKYSKQGFNYWSNIESKLYYGK